MKQESFSDMEYRCWRKKTKREEFLEIMDEIIPWDEWVGIIRPYYPAGKRGRLPIAQRSRMCKNRDMKWYELTKEQWE